MPPGIAGRMKPALLRRAMWAGVAAIAAASALVLALPFIASTRLAGERIAEDMRAWSGLDVAVAEAPRIRFWPALQADLTGVTLSLPDGGAALTAERVEIELSALAALAGNVDFSTARFIRPTVRLAEGSGMPALPPDSRLGGAIRQARDIVLENRLTPDRSRLPDDDFGIVEFSEGRLVRMSGGVEEEIASGLDGKLDWQTLSGRAAIKASGAVRGEPASIDISTGNAMLLLGGAGTQVTLALKSAPMTIAFDGTASLGDSPYADGRASLSTPSARKLMEWPTAAGADNPAPSPITLEGDINGDPARVRLENAAVTVDGRAARGELDLSLSGKRPKLSGSLAFDTLDLAAFLKAFTPFDATAQAAPRAIDEGFGADFGADFAGRLDLDLRLSAARASVGAFEMADFAATTRIDEGIAAFDISDASIFGGGVQAGLRFDRTGGGLHAEMRVLASDIDGGALGAASGLAAVVPQAPASLSLILKGDGASWAALMASAGGSFTADFGQGTIPGLDVDGLVARAKAGVPFPLAEVAAASSIGSMHVKATVAAGRAKVERSEIRSPLNRVTVSGSVGLANGMLALRGTAEPPARALPGSAGTPSATTFLIDGIWSAATVNPAAVTKAD
jgi:AsmA protein